MSHKKTYYVGAQFGPDHTKPERQHKGRKAAYLAAIKQGDPCTVYQHDGRTGHWDLIVDRSMPDASKLPLHAHLRNVLGVVSLKRELREVACTRHGRPSYRWAPGYMVPTNAGHEYPPLSRIEAIGRARAIYGADAICLIE